MSIVPRYAFAATAVVVALGTAGLPTVHLHPTVLLMVIALCAWGIVAYLKSGPFADGHFHLVWTTAVALHTIGFCIPATAIWAALRARRPRLCSALIGVWCLTDLCFLCVLFPAAAGP